MSLPRRSKRSKDASHRAPIGIPFRSARHWTHELLYSGVSRGFKRPWKRQIDMARPRKARPRDRRFYRSRKCA